MYKYLISIMFFLYPKVSFSYINFNRVLNYRNLKDFKLILKYNKDKNFYIKIPKDILFLENKDEYNLYIEKFSKNKKINEIDTFPYFVFK
ncbi:hypothetical protein [endosymbiont of Pachyrhynchus infernalis]|uniref:hypothetical protein n=1 Tax=endosymbiont of Pachyrhynchus infernalis TaxID=1971488 RepID=UPI00102EBDA6|nr:hypothetical protein [endosymbiont of Pachyrhynchus infernalis]